VNLFPCLVTAPDGTVYQTCRVHHDGTATRVWYWDRSDRGRTAPDVVIESTAAPVPQKAGSRFYTLATDDGEAAIRHTTGCACGHPMKRWQLPKPVTEGT
jgi:hypothetical protein